jgi:hypothetical protein
VHLLLADCADATGCERICNPVVDALIEQILDIHQQGKGTIACQNYAHALCLAELGESKRKETKVC